ncbi:SusC/RagA family TonB-linked outer membrane protein [Gelidibacter sp. F63206]|uniref:SusC/RagA family TonB-linked outer membrane protein n=1 Tax=Gelidibacter sp. F63206 TaxID=2926425 RepID=UPI001FF22A1E|nr:SusC/RagA family TonB-linked outer membrane protein [Gelidibacter sp. F63206]MCK0115276.1 SusC/RagA family TonB-linked outer membrane protein [Gelidibacter sp. F63206]
MKQKRKMLMTMLLCLIGLTSSMAQQEIKISGTVTDNQGVPLPGVNVLIEGTTKGTQTDFDGNYAITTNTGDVLVFLYMGMKEFKKTVEKSEVINIQLEEDAQSLDEVVITALGISREKKSLGYATQEVAGEELNNVKSGNFINALSGKASGIQIKKNNNFGGSTNVVIRGNASLTGSNQALFVIDGVPINNTNTNERGQANGRSGYYDYGNAASDINPEDIASVNILKGAAASALYGSRAANGVIMITTKKGKKTEGLGVTISSAVTVGTVDKSTFAKYQNQYGAGYGPSYSGPGNFWNLEDINNDGVLDLTSLYTEDASYGAPFDSKLLVYQWDSFDPDSPNYKKATPWVNAKNGPITFFETPLTTVNSVSFDKAFNGGSMRINYTKFAQEGLMPNSSADRHNFSLSGTGELNDRFTVAGYANYINSSTVGRNSTGYGSNIVGLFKQWWQTNVDIQQLRDIYFSTRRNVTWNPSTSRPGASPLFWDNPYWSVYENYQNDSRNRFIGNITLNYKLADWVNIMARIATDTYSELQEERRANGSTPERFGVSRGNVDSGYARRNFQNTETNYDLTVNFNKNLSDNINLSGLLGTNIRRSALQSIFASTSGGLGVPRLYSLQNSKGPLPLPVERDERIGVDGVFASASLGFNNMLYVDGTIRRDHSSTLPKDNSVYYYPSATVSFVFDKLIKTEVISFGKLRLNFAEVGNSAPFDYLNDSYVVNLPIGTPSTSVKNTKNNPNLKPETTRSVETGLELKFFQNRLGFDITYYKTNSIDQIFGVPVSTSTGYSQKILNAGEIENKGIEISFNAKPVKLNNFSWDMNLNWTKNKNEVVSLQDGIENLQLGDFQGGITINARVGQPYGVIQGSDYTYLNGERIVDPTNGQYIKTVESNKIIGDTNPEWLMGISNKFQYKNLTLGFLLDFQKGGSIFSLDQYYGLATGLYEETAFLNDLGKPVRNSLADGGGFINPGVNPDGSPNTTRIRADRYGAFGYRRGLPDAAFVYDASFVKLREATFTYDLPKKFLQNTFLTDASLSVVGSNLWIIHKNIPHEDPEGGLGAGNIQGYSVGPMPTTRDVSVNLKVQF